MGEFVTRGLDVLIDQSVDDQVAQTVLRLGDADGVALIIPSAWTGSAGLGFQGSATEVGAYADIYDVGGTLVNVAVTAARNIAITGTQLEALLSFDFVKIKAVDAQAADRTITVLKKVNN